KSRPGRSGKARDRAAKHGECPRSRVRRRDDLARRSKNRSECPAEGGERSRQAPGPHAEAGECSPPVLRYLAGRWPSPLSSMRVSPSVKSFFKTLWRTERFGSYPSTRQTSRRVKLSGWAHS